jgi:hypothetical protein
MKPPLRLALVTAKSYGLFKLMQQHREYSVVKKTQGIFI